MTAKEKVLSCFNNLKMKSIPKVTGVSYAMVFYYLKREDPDYKEGNKYKFPYIRK